MGMRKGGMAEMDKLQIMKELIPQNVAIVWL